MSMRQRTEPASSWNHNWIDYLYFASLSGCTVQSCIGPPRQIQAWSTLTPCVVRKGFGILVRVLCPCFPPPNRDDSRPGVFPPRVGYLICLYFATERRLLTNDGEPMNIKWKSSTLVLGMVLALSAPAFANRPWGHPPPPPPQPSGPPSGTSGAAPEVDPSLAIAGISFLAGSLAVLRSRLRK